MQDELKLKASTSPRRRIERPRSIILTRTSKALKGVNFLTGLGLRNVELRF